MNPVYWLAAVQYHFWGLEAGSDQMLPTFLLLVAIFRIKSCSSGFKLESTNLEL